MKATAKHDAKTLRAMNSKFSSEQRMVAYSEFSSAAGDEREHFSDDDGRHCTINLSVGEVYVIILDENYDYAIG